MTIDEDPNYPIVLKEIAKHIKENQVEALCSGRQDMIKFWLSNLQEVKKVGPISIGIFTKDLNLIIDKMMGYEFI